MCSLKLTIMLLCRRNKRFEYFSGYPVGTTSNDVSNSRVKRCFQKCAFRKADVDLMKAGKKGLEFLNIVEELCPDVALDEYDDFDAELSITEPEINVDNLC